MKNYFNRLRVAPLFVLMTAMLSCTDVDDQLGSDFIPIDQTMKLATAVIHGGMETYTVKTDSIPSNNLGYMIFGKRYNPEFGQTVVSSFSYFIPDGFKDEDEKFGYNPVIDSVSILLPIFKVSASTKSGEFGPVDSEQEFGVFQATKYLSPDSVYYPTIDPKTFIDGEPLFTFKHGGTVPDDILYKTLASTPKGEVFLNELLTSSSDELNIDTLFIKKFKGLYIAPMDQSREDAVIYYSGTRTSENAIISASIQIHYHNYERDKPLVPKNIKDTLTQAFSFTDAIQYRKLAFAVVKHDYTGSVVEQHIASPADTVIGAPGDKQIYVQSMAGVNSFVRFSDELSKRINLLKERDGIVYSKIIINSAKLSFRVKSADDLYVLNDAPKRLGMYYSYKGYLPTPAPDYDLLKEYNTGIESVYGGELNRLKGRYEMDITTYIQWIAFNGEDKNPFKEMKRGVHFAPIYSSSDFNKFTSVNSNAAFQSYSQIELIGSSSPIPDDNVDSEATTAPRLELTFTLIK